MNGWFSRSAVAKDLTLAQHFISCERTQHELSTSAVGSLRTFAATHNDDCNADEVTFRCNCTNGCFAASPAMPAFHSPSRAFRILTFSSASHDSKFSRTS
jgi:hypothetical protein